MVEIAVLTTQPEVFVAHANARLTLHGRTLLVRRVRLDGRPVAHVAKELGISRQCAHRWVRRYDEDGWPGLRERSSRPHRVANRTCAAVEEHVVTCRRALRCGPAPIAAHTGVPERTVSRILRRHHMPHLADCDPLTGTPIRTGRTSSLRYEHELPGDLIHLDVKKIGRIPDGGGWRAHGRSEQVRGRGIGYDYVHAAVDDHSRLAYTEIHADETKETTTAFWRRAQSFFTSHGITIARVLTDIQTWWCPQDAHFVRPARWSSPGQVAGFAPRPKIWNGCG
ncbi:transposase [Streptosporangium brasiliense]|uniref:Transposase n=1 Tax=Streptosporangium brasiliense TaxID=47480 RepID=A0ABT9RIA7_9ACTN|nr:transposase [Streptosporangium brasiliense]